MHVTADDVARRAGVSASTVSRALTAPHKVAPDTRRRVIEAAEKLHYQPSRAARDLARGRTENLGLIIPDLENPYFSSLTKAIHARAHALGYQLFVTDTDEDPGEEPEILRRLARDVDGVVMCSPRAKDQDIVAFAGETRIVTINRSIGDLPSVVMDEADSMAQALAHLVALGHRDIAYAGGPIASWSDRGRRGAFTHLARDNADIHPHDLGSFKPYFAGGIAAADLLLALPATAVVAFNDLIALGLLDRVKDRGVGVPNELSIVSFDNTMLATAVTPHLTSVEFPARFVARQALDMLLEPASGVTGDPPRQILTTQLNVRASTGPVSAQIRKRP